MEESRGEGGEERAGKKRGEKGREPFDISVSHTAT